MFDVIIIGGGPAGVAAGVYAARKRLRSLLVAKEWGGQSVVSPDVQNWIGTISVPGVQFAKMLEEHARAYAEDVLTIQEDTVVSVTGPGGVPGTPLAVVTEGGKTYKARALLVCTGSHRRKLDIPGAKEFDNKGISYCASCDAPLFGGKDVIVVGGGNAGFEAAAQLVSYAKSVLLLERSGAFGADPVTQEKVLASDKVTAVVGAELVEVRGGTLLDSVTYKDAEGEHVLEVGGVFVEIGALPNSDFVKNVVELNKHGEIVVDCKTQRSSIEGIWAAGDVSDVLYKQNNISAGDAVVALEDIYLYLTKNGG